jgi:hypothetical protein
MKSNVVIKAISNMLPYLDSQSDLDEVVTYMSEFSGGGESAVSLDELREEQNLPPHIDFEAVDEAGEAVATIRINNAREAVKDVFRNLSIQERETVLSSLVESPLYDPEGPEDGGHPY